MRLTCIIALFTSYIDCSRSSMNVFAQYSGKELVTWDKQPIERQAWKAGIPDDITIEGLIPPWPGNGAPHVMFFSRSRYHHFARHGEKGMVEYWNELTVNLTNYFHYYKIHVNQSPSLSDWVRSLMRLLCIHVNQHISLFDWVRSLMRLLCQISSL